MSIIPFIKSGTAAEMVGLVNNLINQANGLFSPVPKIPLVVRHQPSDMMDALNRIIMEYNIGTSSALPYFKLLLPADIISAINQLALLMNGAGGGQITGSVKAVGIRTMNTTTAVDTTSQTTTITGMNCQIKHVMLNSYAATNIRLFYANRLSDVAATYTITVKAAIEYPLGTFTRVTFNSGSQSVTIAPTFTDVESDIVPGLTIPAGATYYEHVFVSFALAQGCPFLHVRQLLAANGDGFSASNGEVDKSMTSLAASSNSYYYGATAIVGNTNCPFAYGIVGDSIISAGGDTQTGLYVGWAERGVNGAYGTVNVGQSSEQGSQFLASHAGRMGLLRRCGLTHALMEYATNDINGGLTLVQTENMIRMINALLAASNINPSNSTVIPRTSSTDNWATIANQTPLAGFGVGQTADQLNTAMLTSPLTFATTVFDVNTPMQSPGNPRFWTVNGTTFYYTNDGTHPNATSSPVAAAALLLANIGSPGVPIPLLLNPGYAGGGFYLNANDLAFAQGANVTSWKDRLAGITGTNNTIAPTMQLLNAPEKLQSSVRSASANSAQGMIFNGSAVDNLAAGSFYILMAIRLNTSSAGAILFNKLTSNNRFIINAGNTGQLDLFFNTSAYSFQTMSLAGTAGANDWTVIEITWNSATPTQLGMRSAAGFGSPNAYTQTAATNGSGGPKSDTGTNMFLGCSTAGGAVLDGDIAVFYLTRTLPAQADADRAFYYLRGTVGC